MYLSIHNLNKQRYSFYTSCWVPNILTILAIQNNNYTQEHKIYVKNIFSLKGKTMGETHNQFTIIKSIIIILVYVSRLKKNLSYFFFAFTHTNYLSQRRQHFALFFLFSSPCTALSLSCLLSLSSFLLAALSIHLCVHLF